MQNKIPRCILAARNIRVNLYKVSAFCIAAAPACICSNRTRFRSGKNAAAHRMLQNSIQGPAFLHGPLWNQMHAGAAAMQKAETPNIFSLKLRTDISLLSLVQIQLHSALNDIAHRSEERRVGKECL